MSSGRVEKCPPFAPITLRFLEPQQRTICLVKFRAVRNVHVARPLRGNARRIVSGRETIHRTYETHVPAIVFYLGINDCGRTSSDDLEPIVEAIFDVLHDLYTKSFARNFVLIDVPPIDRSPGGMVNSSVSASARLNSGPSRGIRLS